MMKSMIIIAYDERSILKFYHGRQMKILEIDMTEELMVIEGK